MSSILCSFSYMLTYAVYILELFIVRVPSTGCVASKRCKTGVWWSETILYRLSCYLKWFHCLTLSQSRDAWGLLAPIASGPGFRDNFPQPVISNS